MAIRKRIEVKTRITHNYDDFLRDVRRIQREDDFTLVVLDSINAIQRFQRMAAPKRKDRRIPRSIEAASVRRTGNTWSATSRTTYPPAIFTNEGTGIHAGRGYYEIRQIRTFKKGPRQGQEYEVNIQHPGIRGTHWWERGTARGGMLAFQSFERKVERMLRIRGEFA